MYCYTWTASKNDRIYIVSCKVCKKENVFNFLRKKIIDIFIKYTEYARTVKFSKNFNFDMYNEDQESILFIKNLPNLHFELKETTEGMPEGMTEETKNNVVSFNNNVVSFNIIKNYYTNLYLDKYNNKNEKYNVVSFSRKYENLDQLYIEVTKEVVDNIKKFEDVNSTDFHTIIGPLVKKWTTNDEPINFILLHNDLSTVSENIEFLNEKNANVLKLFIGLVSKNKKDHLDLLLQEPILRSIFTKDKDAFNYSKDLFKKFGPNEITPLMFASVFNPEIEHILLSYGLDPETKDIYGITSADYKKYANVLF